MKKSLIEALRRKNVAPDTWKPPTYEYEPPDWGLVEVLATLIAEAGGPDAAAARRMARTAARAKVGGK